MRKYLSLAVCFIASFAYAQNPGNNQKKLAYKVADELVANYMQYSKINDSVSKEALKQLFSKNATIPNEIVPAYYYNDKKDPEKIPDVSINDYFSKLKEVYPQGYGYVKFLNSAISYSNLNKREVSAIFQKNIVAYTFTGLQLEVSDTIQLHILLSPDYKSALISKIDLLGHAIKFVNDDDADFVSNEKDKCKTERGLNSPDGCYTAVERDMIAAAEQKRRDSSLYLKQIKLLEVSLSKLSAEMQQAAPPRLWGSIGGAAGAVSSTLSGDNAYKTSNVKSTSNPASVFDGAKFSQGYLGLHYFFGAKANIGIGVGLNYNMLNGNAGKDSFHVEYTETDKYGSKFTQLVSSRGTIREKVKIKNLSIPVTLVYKGDFDQKFGYSIEAGVLYNLSYKSTVSSANSTAFDLEAEYLFNGTAANGGDYSDPTVPYNKASWLITRSQAVAHGATDNGTAYLNDMGSQGFYVGAAATATSVNSTSNFKNGAVGFIIKPSISYHFNETTSLSAGFLFTSVTFNQKENTYRLFDKNRTYNTLLSSVNSMSDRNTGFHITFSTALYNPGKARNARTAKIKAELADYRKKLAQLQAH